MRIRDKVKRKFFGFLFIGVLCNMAYGAEINKKILNNGLVILTKESRANDIVAIQIFLKMGTGYEKEEEAGLSNIVQNLLLKGTAKRNATELANDIESIGARITTSAERDYGTVQLYVIKDKLDKGLEILFDILQNPTFPEDKVEQEKKIVMEQIKARKDEMLPTAFDLFQERFYDNHPYHKTRLGYPETVGKFDRQTILKFYKDYYVPNNMVWSAVGNFNSSKLIKAIERNFSGLPPKELPSQEGKTVPMHTEEVSNFIERESQAAWMVIGYDAPHIYDKDYAAMEVLESIMGGSMNSRLFIALREKKGLGYQVGSIYEARSGPSFYANYIGVDPGQLDEAKSEILKEMERIRREEVDEDELRRTKAYLKGTFIMAQESNAGQAYLIGRYEILGLGYQYLFEYPKAIDNVKVEDILKAAGKYLKSYTLSAIVPKK